MKARVGGESTTVLPEQRARNDTLEMLHLFNGTLALPTTCRGIRFLEEIRNSELQKLQMLYRF